MTDKVTMKALDTFHMSNVQPDNLVAGDVFSCSENDAKQLEARGLAERGGKASDAVNADRATPDRPDTREELDKERGFDPGKAISAAPTNKAEPAPPSNKAIAPSPARKRIRSTR